MDLVPIDKKITQLADEIFYKDKDNNIYAIPTEICRFVGYEYPNDEASKVYKKYKERLAKFETIAKMTTVSGPKNTRYLFNDGVHFFIMQLKLPLALDLQMSYARIVEYYRKTHDSKQRQLIVLEQMAELVKSEIKHDTEIKSLTNGQLKLEDNQKEMLKAQSIYEEKLSALTDELVDLTKPQRAEIRRKIKQLVDKFKYMFPNRTRNQLFASFGGILIDWFDVAKYDDIPQSRFVEAMNVLNCLEIATEERLIDLNGYVEVWKVRNIFSKIIFPKYNGNKQRTLDF